MRDYININLVAAYLTDANGVPTPIDMLDWQGISLLSGQAPNLPNTFAANQWSVASGTGPREVIITVSVLPANGGSPLSGIQYRFGNGAWATLTGVNTGPRTVLAPAAGESYEVSLRAVNASGPSDPSATKTVTSGAPAATAPAQFAVNQWAVNTGTNPAEVVLDITALPSNGGSVLTALQYRVGTGAWTALTGVGTGQRVLTMTEPGASYSIAVRAVNAVGAGAESAAKTVTSAGAALSAPSVSSATIDGTTEQSGTLTANIVMAGNPAPSVESIQWKKNGGNINGATSPTWTKTGLTAGDVISYAYVVANGVLPKATGNASNPITIAALPAITAVVSPNPVIANEPYTVTFNVVPDTVTPAGLTGTGQMRSGTAPASGSVTISATKAGYADLPTLEIAVTVPAPALVATSANTLQAVNVDASTPDFPITFTGGPYAGTYTGKPSVMATGPQYLVNPKQTGGTAVGAVHTADLGLILNLESGGPVSLTYRWLRGSTAISQSDNAPYTVQAADQGQTLKLEVSAEDTKGKRVYTTAGVAIPAANNPTDTFTAADNTTIGAYSGTGESGRSYNLYGAAAGIATIIGGYVVASTTAGFVAANDSPAGGYTVTAQMLNSARTDLPGYNDRGAWPAVGISAGNTGWHFRNDRGNGTLKIIKVAAGTISAQTTTANNATLGMAFNANGVAYTVTMTVTPSQDGTTATCVTKVNGTEFAALTFSDPALLTGKAGMRFQTGGTIEYNKINTFTVEAL